MAGGSSSNQELVQWIRSEFYKCSSASADVGSSPDGTWVYAADLACRWERLAEEEGSKHSRKRLSEADRQAIGLRVAQCMREMDIRGENRIGLEEWTHYMLLRRWGTKQVNSLLAGALESDPDLLKHLQGLFSAADSSSSGVLSFEDVVAMYKRRLWHLRPGNERARFATEGELSAGNPEQFAREIIRAMDLDGDSCVSYREFMAYTLGRRKREVLLHVYDLSGGMAQPVSPWLVGERLEGIWHTGTVVYGKEYYYTKDTVLADPGTTAFGKPTRVLHMGYTLWQQDELHDFVTKELKPVFQRATYDIVGHNCNHFTDRVLTFLVGGHPPPYVMRQPELLLRSGSIRLLRPVLNWWVRDRIAARENRQLQLRAGEPLPCGTVVYVHLESEASVLGQVVRPPLSESSRRPEPVVEGCSCSCGDPLVAEPHGLWVQWLDVALGGGCCLRTEFMPAAQLTVVGLREFEGEAAYRTAMTAMSKLRPPFATEHCLKVNRGLAPRQVPLPGGVISEL